MKYLLRHPVRGTKVILLSAALLMGGCTMHQLRTAAPPHHAKPLLLDLLDTYRGQWRHPAWLGQVMDLEGPVSGLFALPAPISEQTPLRLAVLLTPSTAPADWGQAELRWIEPDDSERYSLGDDDHWGLEVSLERLGPHTVRADLSDIHFNQAFLSPVCLAGIVIETPDEALTPLALMPVGPEPTFRLETDAVGNLAIGKKQISLRLRTYNPLDTPFSETLHLEWTEKLTGESAGDETFALSVAPGRMTEREIKIDLPRFGVFEVQLLGGNPAVPLTSLRVTRVPEPRRDISPEASSFGINIFQHQLWWYALQPPLLQAMGAKWVRPWLAWENTWRMQEPEPGRYDFTHLDNAIDQVERYGMAYENILFCSPESVGGSGLLQTPPPPDKMALWSDWVRALVTHFRGRIQHYEVWNEPDMMWPGTAGEHADEYVPLLKAARRAAKEVDADCVIDAPSSAGYRRWLSDTTRLGARDLTDVFTFHTYSAPAAFNHHMRMRLDLWGGAEGWNKPVWLNEIGIAGCDLNPDFNQQIGSNELNQAQILVGDATLFLAERPEGKVFWFCSLDPHDPFNKSEWNQEGNYPGDAAVGLLYEGLLPKIGFVAFAALTREIDGRKALGQWSPAPGLRVVAFEGARAVVFHDDLENSPAFPALALGCSPDETLTVLDVCGNERQRGRAAEMSLDCSLGPIYVRGSQALERLGREWGTLIRLRPPGILNAGDEGKRMTSLPPGATVECEVFQDGEALEVSLTRGKNQATLSVRAAEGVEHALAYVRLRLQTKGHEIEDIFPVTIGTLSLFDAPGFTQDPASLCLREREGGVDWSEAEGHLAPGCLALSAPYNGRLVNWQQWYLGLQVKKPLRWSVWLKSEELRNAECRIALAQFGEGEWLGDRLLVAPEQCPTGDSGWVRLEGQVDPGDYPEGLGNVALYVDLATPGRARAEGRLLIDELDVWQPEE